MCSEGIQRVKEMCRMRRLFPVVLLCSLILFSACSNDAGKEKLSELSENELVEFLTEKEISLPNGVEVSSIQEMLSDLEEDPDRHAPVVSWSVITDFYEDLRAVVKDYYEIST